MCCTIILHQLTTEWNYLLVDPSVSFFSCRVLRYIGSNRIISLVLIKYKKIISNAATAKNPYRNACIMQMQSNVLFAQKVLEFV